MAMISALRSGAISSMCCAISPRGSGTAPTAMPVACSNVSRTSSNSAPACWRCNASRGESSRMLMETLSLVCPPSALKGTFPCKRGKEGISRPQGHDVAATVFLFVLGQKRKRIGFRQTAQHAGTLLGVHGHPLHAFVVDVQRASRELRTRVALVQRRIEAGATRLRHAGDACHRAQGESDENAVGH